MLNLKIRSVFLIEEVSPVSYCSVLKLTKDDLGRRLLLTMKGKDSKPFKIIRYAKERVSTV